MLKVRNSITRLGQHADALTLYRQLHQNFSANELFLLESLAGPDIAMRKSIIGFGPVLSLSLKNGIFTLSGHPVLCEALNSIINQNGISIFQVLRSIETSFDVDYQSGPNLPHRFGFFGYFAYDAVRYMESIPSIIEDTNHIPDLVLQIYQGMIHVDLKTQETYLIYNDFAGIESLSESQIIDLLHQTLPNLKMELPAPRDIHDTVSKKDYLTWVDKAFEHIRQGDIFQIQLGHEIQIKSPVDPLVVYQRMRELNPSPFMYFTQLQDMTIIGASPELCVNLKQDLVTIRPIAGTIKRGQNEAEDQIQQAKLLADPKERAEHLMLIDLARNDIGRVCKPGTLQVTEYMVLERYSHVFHIVSNVIGNLAKDFDHYDVIAASFPAGTLTGTPKIRAMELIEETEKTRRGIYGGTLGLIDFRGNTEMAICIRTALYQSQTYSIRASAGIVIDSKPEAEWQETISKMSAPYLAITGRELKNEDFTH